MIVDMPKPQVILRDLKKQATKSDDLILKHHKFSLTDINSSLDIYESELTDKNNQIFATYDNQSRLLQESSKLGIPSLMQGYEGETPVPYVERDPFIFYRDEIFAGSSAETNVGLGSQIYVTDFLDSVQNNFHEITTFPSNLPEQNVSLSIDLLSKFDTLTVDEEGDYDDDFLIPNDYSVREMKSLISQLYEKFGDSINEVHITPDGKGGLESTFQNNNRYLQIIVPADKNKAKYIFHKAGDQYGIAPFSSIYELCKWLDWLHQKNLP